MPKTKREDGRYQFQLYLGKDENGKRLTKTFYGKSMAEARRKAEDYRRGSQETSELLLTHIGRYNPKNATERFRIEYFLPFLGKMKIADINPKDIEGALKPLALNNPNTGKPTAQRTLKRYLDDLNKVFLEAQKNRQISFNPCQFVSLPATTPPKEREALTEEQRSAVLDSDCLAAQLMLCCGLRRGELTALTWADIRNNNIYVTKSYDFKNKQIKAPKTKDGIRCIPIPKRLQNLILSERKGHSATDFIITVNGNMMIEYDWQKMNEELCKNLGFTFTWHQLRHTYATILFSAGVDVLTAKELLGHSDVETTMGIYTHLEKTKKQASIDKLNEYLQ